MKHLSQMTRDDLWALECQQLLEIAHEHGVRTWEDVKRADNGKVITTSRTEYSLKEELEQRRLELQQDSAESQTDR